MEETKKIDETMINEIAKKNNKYTFHGQSHGRLGGICVFAKWPG